MNSWDRIPGRNQLFLQYPLLFLPGCQCSFVSGQSCATSILAKCSLQPWERQHTHFLNELSQVLQLHIHHCNLLVRNIESTVESPVETEQTSWETGCLLKNYMCAWQHEATSSDQWQWAWITGICKFSKEYKFCTAVGKQVCSRALQLASRYFLSGKCWLC